MARQNRWVRYDQNKVPLNASTGNNASSTNPETWTSLATAKKSNYGIGIGYVLGEGIGCIDLDHCLIDGQPTERAQELIDQHPNSYIEVSPSGTGLHIWGLRDEQPGTRQVIDGLHVEVYSSGRYITVTGNAYQHGGLENL